MPEGPRDDDDFYAWTRYQAEVRRTLRTGDKCFDRERVAEEIEDLGRSEGDAVRSPVRRIFVHFLKLAYSPAREPRFGWMASVVNAPAQLDDKLSPSLRGDIDDTLAQLYANARKQAALELQEHGERDAALSVPADCPYAVDQSLADDWYPIASPNDQPADVGSGEAL